MAATFFHQSAGLQGWGIDASGTSMKLGNFSVRFISRRLGGNVALSRKVVHASGPQKLRLIHGSISYSSAADATSVNNAVNISQDSSSE